MATNNNNNIKIHEHFNVVPQSSTQTTTTTPLTFFDIYWLRFHPVERVFFYTLPNSQSHPTFFFQNIVPKLKNSLSLTLQHFLPLAGKIIWPSDSSKPFIQFNPNNDGVSMLIAESNLDFDYFIENSQQNATFSRSLVPHLESTDSFASIIAIQVTLFPSNGVSIGISTHHAVFDGKSSTVFMKAWAYLCKQTIETKQESPPPTLLPKFEPLLNKEIINDPNGLGESIAKNWMDIITKMFPDGKGNKRTLQIAPFEPKLDDSIRATFELKREDLDKINQRVLSKWEIFDTINESNSKPQTLSSFVLTCAYSLVCLAKAIKGIENSREKFIFSFAVDCRARLEPQLPDNYFGSCVWSYFIDAKPLDFVEEDGVFLVAKCIHEKIKMINEKGVVKEYNNMSEKYFYLLSEGIEIMGVAGSNRFGVYETNFGWGRPEKVEIVSVDRGLIIGLKENRDGKGGNEVGVVLNKHAMDLFSSLFVEGLSSN